MATVKVEAWSREDWYPMIDVDEWWAERVDDDVPADYIGAVALHVADALEDWTGDRAAELVEKFHRALVDRIGRTSRHWHGGDVIYSGAQCNYDTNLSDDGSFLVVDYWRADDDDLPAMGPADVLAMFGVDDVDELHDYVVGGPRRTILDSDGIYRKRTGHWWQSEVRSHGQAVEAWSAALELGARVSELAGETVAYWNAHSGYLIPRYNVGRWIADEPTDVYRDDVWARCTSGLVPMGDGTGRPYDPDQLTLDDVPAPRPCNWGGNSDDGTWNGLGPRVDDDGDVIRDDDGEPILACPECGGRVELYG